MQIDEQRGASPRSSPSTGVFTRSDATATRIEMKKPLRVLIVDDNRGDAELIVRQLRTAGCAVDWDCVDTESAYLARLRPDLDIILSDYSMLQFSGLRALALLQTSRLQIPFIIICGSIGEDLAVAALKQGASDYLFKDRLLRLGSATAHALDQFRVRRERAVAKRQVTRAIERLNNAQRIGKIGDWDYNIATGAVTWSPQVFAIFERDPKLGPPRDADAVAALYDAASQPVMREHIARAVETGEIQEGELSGHHADGEVFHVRTVAVPRKDAEGKVSDVYGTVQDITERTRVLASYKDSQQRLALATEAAAVGIWDLDVVADKLTWDERMYSIYGISEQEFSGALGAWESGVHPDDGTRVVTELTAAIEGVRDFHTEFRVLWPSGEVRYVEAHAVVQRGANDAALRMIGINWDITERKRAELRIKRLNRVYAVLSGINSLIVRVQDRNQLFNEACQIAIDLGQFRIAWIAVVDQSERTITPAASAGMRPDLLELIEDRWTLSECTSLDGDTSTAKAIRDRRPHVVNTIRGDTTMIMATDHEDRGLLSMAILPVVIAGESVGVLSLYSDEDNFFDAEEMKLLEELAGDIAFAIDHIERRKRLDYLAYYDVLTGLANRNLLLERLGQFVDSATRDAGRFTLLLFDLERFRNINDSLGQLAGDALLTQVAKWLTSNLPHAMLLARVSADKFAVVLPDVAGGDPAAQSVDRLMEAFLRHSFRSNDASLGVAAKVGFVQFPEDGTSVDTLFRNAEAALKKAKLSGIRYLRYTREMTEAIAGKLTLESQLRQALEKEEFVLHYQPKVSLLTGRITGAEALIRWNDPRTGLVLPARFIPLLEETGLILEVGRWVLHRAISDYRRWRDARLAVVRVAVNVSSLQLRQHDFVADLEKVISVDACAAAGLELEITESLIMEDIKHSVSSLQAIRAMNINVAIDDFGTGFSSLSYLSKLPLDSLKIDRAFVTDMTNGPQGLALVSTIVNLAHSLKLKVVAEGVETEEQARLLRLLGCDEMQGYLESKPVAADIFASKYLGSHSERVLKLHSR